MIEIKTTVRGTLADAYLSDRIVRKAIAHEVIGAIGERLTRKGAQGSGGKGLGVRRNRVTRAGDEFATVEVHSTLRNPRTKGTAWRARNIAIVKSMAPRVTNAAARRIEAELG